jgi:hypothetical protein
MMECIKYLDFDLLIRREADDYLAEVLNSPAGQASNRFPNPFSEIEVENFLLKLGRRRPRTRRIDSSEIKAAKIFGGRLFSTVFAGEIYGCLRSSIEQADHQGCGLRIRLRLTDTPELGNLPWEYLYNNRFIALSNQTPIIRYLHLPERIRALGVSPPIRLLVMISNPKNYPQLDVEREWVNLREALSGLEQRGLLELVRLEKATLPGLQQQLRRANYHIFHFIGHAGFDDHTEDGLLILEDTENQGHRISGQYLGTLLCDHKPMRLVVLNSCEGARSSLTDPFAGVAQSLLQQGMSAVIAMQFEITDEAAISFAYGFYGALADNYPVDAALGEARKTIYTQGNDFEWGTPVIYLRSPDGQIFEVESVRAEGHKKSRLAVLYNDAQLAFEAEDWATAVETLQLILSVDPSQREAAVKLEEAQRRQELFHLYSNGRSHYEAKRWPEALETFEQLYKQGGNYKDVVNLIAEIRKETDVIVRDIAQGKELTDSYSRMVLPIARQRKITSERRWATIGISVAIAEAVVILLFIAPFRSLLTHVNFGMRPTKDWIWLLIGILAYVWAGYYGYFVVLPRQIALKRHPANIRKLIISVVLLVNIAWFYYVFGNAGGSVTTLFLFVLWFIVSLIFLLTKRRVLM